MYVQLWHHSDLPCKCLLYLVTYTELVNAEIGLVMEIKNERSFCFQTFN